MNKNLENPFNLERNYWIQLNNDLSQILSDGCPLDYNFDQYNIENLTVIIEKIKDMNEPGPKHVNTSVHLDEDAEI